MLNGKVALVTGASRGIGKAIAIDLAKNGADVVVNYRSDNTQALEVVEQIKKNGKQGLTLKADIGNFNDVRDMFDRIKDKFGKLDILVNNAGIVRDRTLKNMSPEEWNAVINTNLTGAFNVTKNALEIMADYGSIVNISSIVGINGNFGQSNYASSKAGIIGLTKSLAKEVAKKNIRVNAVAPGFIKTEMTNEIPYIRKIIVRFFIPLKRLGTVEDVAHVVTFLVSDKSNYITGQVIRVDGGLMF
jgi:3-oxoacyl-[acyl-carrier protein] reductase